MDGCGDGGGELVLDVAAMLDGPFLHVVGKISSPDSGDVAVIEVGVAAIVASTDVWLWLLEQSRLATSSLS